VLGNTSLVFSRTIEKNLSLLKERIIPFEGGKSREFGAKRMTWSGENIPLRFSRTFKNHCLPSK
jgi:hypothetical protein